jgi:hypothetical protein
VSKQFWLFLVVGLAIVGGLLYTWLETTEDRFLRLDGSILKVRVLAMGQASLAVADFRVSNPSGVPFVVRSVEMSLDPESGDPVAAAIVSRTNVEQVFRAMKLIGPKYSDVLTIEDRVLPNATVDRMAVGRFELPESAVAARKTLRLKIEDVDGTVAELTEMPSEKR